MFDICFCRIGAPGGAAHDQANTERRLPNSNLYVSGTIKRRAGLGAFPRPSPEMEQSTSGIRKVCCTPFQMKENLSGDVEPRGDLTARRLQSLMMAPF